MMNDELQVVGVLDSGWLGRKVSLKGICDEIEEVNWYRNYITNENNLSEIKENTLLELIENEEMQYAI